jgi:predicted Zn finger-like uncharacterized protein
MLIVCPACANSFLMADTSLGSFGRHLRCRVCETVWFVRPSGPAQTSLVEASDDPRRFRHGVFLSGQGQRAWPRVSPALGGFLGLIVLAMALVGFREHVVRLAGSAAPVYAAIGLPVNLHGLSIRAMKSTLLEEPNVRVLAVEAEITNLRQTQTQLPDLRLALRGRDGQEIYSWTAKPPKARLEGGESIAFRTRLSAPPEGARDLLVRFAAAESANGIGTNGTRTNGTRQ